MATTTEDVPIEDQAIEDQAAVADDLSLGDLYVETPEGSLKLACNAAAYYGNGPGSMLYLVSAAGPHTSIKALCALLNTPKSNAQLKLALPPSEHDRLGRSLMGICKHPGRYKVYRANLGFNTWQALAIADAPLFMPVVDDASLWRRFKSDKFTTPILRSWMPWLREQLADRQLISPLNCFECNSAMVYVTTENLDLLVTQGIASGDLRIE